MRGSKLYFGFVELSSSPEAGKAKEALNGTEYSGRTLSGDEEPPPKNRSFGGGRGDYWRNIHG